MTTHGIYNSKLPCVSFWVVVMLGSFLLGCSSDTDSVSGVISPPAPEPSPVQTPMPTLSPTATGDSETGPSEPTDPMTEPMVDVDPVTLTLQRIASGLDSPLYLTSAPGNPGRLFILEQRSGNIMILDRDAQALQDTPFLTVPSADLISTGYEQGLLGLAFHPDFESNGLFYINYTAPGEGPSGQTKLVEYRTLDGIQADPSSARIILTIPQPDQNHNGGWMDFDTEGYLYWATGDGGGLGFLSSGIQVFSQNSQDINDNLLGKILRIDVNGDDFPQDPNRNYRIPPDNPFVGREGDDEIWVYGLRNPWRASFDSLTGDLYIGDVGQDLWEEINIQSALSPGGENYGWAIREGTSVLDRSRNPDDLVEPAYVLPHNNGQSVTGGYVYRGTEILFDGRYFFGVFSTPSFGPSQILSFQFTGSEVIDVIDHTPTLNPDVGSLDLLGSFGRDGDGHLYAIDLDGEIFRLIMGSQPVESLSDPGDELTPSS